MYTCQRSKFVCSWKKSSNQALKPVLGWCLVPPKNNFTFLTHHYNICIPQKFRPPKLLFRFSIHNFLQPKHNNEFQLFRVLFLRFELFPSEIFLFSSICEILVELFQVQTEVKIPKNLIQVNLSEIWNIFALKNGSTMLLRTKKIVLNITNNKTISNLKLSNWLFKIIILPNYF